MKALNFDELHIYAYDHGAICVANPNCTLCPLYKSDGVNEDCLY